MNRTQYYAKGKVLLSAEYFVTEGASALALPVKFGQRLIVEDHEGLKDECIWRSYNADNSLWFEVVFHLPGLEIKNFTNADSATVVDKLKDILQAVVRLQSNFLQKLEGKQITTQLEFPRDWGLGSSSTLISLLSQWSHVSAYDLLELSFKGSGYDIAAATAEGPIIYRKWNANPEVELVHFFPSFHNQLFFLHLNQKQDSREALVNYQICPIDTRRQHLNRISQITHNMLRASFLSEFDELIREHEAILVDILKRPRVKDLYFSDFWGEIKSLGAWGGDFVLISSNRTVEETKNYFKEKGYSTFFTFEDFLR